MHSKAIACITILLLLPAPEVCAQGDEMNAKNVFRIKVPRRKVLIGSVISCERGIQ
jgi:hypothetical protein